MSKAAMFDLALASSLLTAIPGEYLALSFLVSRGKIDKDLGPFIFGYYVGGIFEFAAFISACLNHRLELAGCSIIGTTILYQTFYAHRDYRRERLLHPPTGQTSEVDSVETPAAPADPPDTGDQGNSVGSGDP